MCREFEVRWQALLHANERRVAVAIANEIAPQGTRAQRASGLDGSGAAQRAERPVKASGFAELRDARITLTDPLFARSLYSLRRLRAPGLPDGALESIDAVLLSHHPERVGM